MTDAYESPTEHAAAKAKQTSRSIQVIATVTGAFSLPLMVSLSVGGQAPAWREIALLCLATTIGAAVGFAFFLPEGSLSRTASLFRKVGSGTAVGLVMGIVTLSRLQMPPLAPTTIFGLGLFAALGALGAWGLSLRDDLSDRRRRHEAVAWPVKVFFCNGLLSLAAWVSIWAAGCIAYILVDITHATSGRKTAGTTASVASLNLESSARSHLGIAAQNQLPGQRHAEQLVTRLIDRSVDVLGNVEANRPTSGRQIDASIATEDAVDHANLSFELALQPTLEPIAPGASEEDETDISRYEIANVPQLLTMIEDATSSQRHVAISALDRFDPNDLKARAHRKAIAKMYLALAVDTSFPETQAAGVRGMIRWGGKFSVPHLNQLLENDPDVALAEVIFAALGELNDPRGAAAVKKMAERPEYREAALASLRAMEATVDPAPSDAPASSGGD